MKYLLKFFITIFLWTLVLTDDFYERLGISKNANDREIRKAFKKKALLLHPDKNPDDPHAQERFIEVNRAYEVLKDQDLRKKYDLHGEDGLDDSKSHGRQYHSWNYYQESFGIYDDDPEIITLNKADFEASVSGTDDVWFVNFYHPMCSHCHTLAPVWREIARELEGVVRVGAVNCDDEFQLCHSQGIRSYPSLFSYPGQIHYTREKSKEQLISYILKEVTASLINLPLSPTIFLSQPNSNEHRPSKWWLVVSYQTVDDAESYRSKVIMLAAILDGLVNVGPLHCFSHADKRTCNKLGMNKDLKVRLYDSEDLINYNDPVLEIDSLDAQEIAAQVLQTLPDLPLLSNEKYKDIRASLISRKDTKPWLLQFTNNNDDDNLEVRKLQGLTDAVHFGRISCAQMKRECDELYIVRTPTFMLFKPGGGYEIHQGRVIARDIVRFGKDGATATQFQILTPKEFPKVLSDGMWFVDFYAPWCPPCMRLLPEFRKASRHVENVRFGTIDCTAHSDLCSTYNIRSYPTTILYNNSVTHQYRGHHSFGSIVEFVKDVLNPSVIELTEDNFSDLVLGKAHNEVWVVDFFANWCGPCQQMTFEYSRFARLIKNLKNVRVGKIDCAQYPHTCQSRMVRSYPTIKIYKEGVASDNKAVVYPNNWSRDAHSFKQWIYQHIQSQVKELDYQGYLRVLSDSDPWVIDFFSPNCGYCHKFAPEFEDIANELEDKMKAGKVNCLHQQKICSRERIDAYPTVKLFVGKSLDPRNDGIEMDSLDPEVLSEEIIDTLESMSKQDDDYDNLHDEL